MTRGPLQPFRRGTLRRLAGFVATFLLAGQALAATGLCLVTSPDAAATVHEASTACAQHAPADPSDAPGVKHHCPAEEPSPQSRAVDLPTPPPVVPVAGFTLQPVDPAADRLVQAIPDHAVPPAPLYARLQRLRL